MNFFMRSFDWLPNSYGKQAINLDGKFMSVYQQNFDSKTIVVYANSVSLLPHFALWMVIVPLAYKLCANIVTIDLFMLLCLFLSDISCIYFYFSSLLTILFIIKSNIIIINV